MDKEKLSFTDQMELDIQKVKDYTKDSEHPYITLVGLFNLARKDNISELAIVDVEGHNFKRAMKYLNENTWVIEYMDIGVLLDFKNSNYYNLGSSEVDRLIRLELIEREEELPYWEKEPQLQPESEQSIEE